MGLWTSDSSKWEQISIDLDLDQIEQALSGFVYSDLLSLEQKELIAKFESVPLSLELLFTPIRSQEIGKR